MHPRPSILKRALRPRLHASGDAPSRKPSSARPSSSSSTSSPRSRLDRITHRLPPPLRKFLNPLIGAPGTHITSFLILHELTAIVPLVGLGTMFHWTGWLPFQGVLGEERLRGYEERFGRWFGRRGWFGVEKPPVVGEGGGEEAEDEGMSGEGGEYGRGTRIVLEVATAYAVTKAILPLRIVGSVWATPWFARNVLGRVVDIVKRIRR